jgi:ATP-dependent helicase HrpB
MSYKEIKDRQVWPTPKSWLNPAQRDLVDRYTPERIALPGGRTVKITYAENAPPRVAARIQDLYGVKGNLTIAMGRVPLVIEVLAPNHRPVQVTEDLERFWRDTYPGVKKELQRRYPKHEWR